MSAKRKQTWLRMINSSQRRIDLPQPVCPNRRLVEHITIEIQGLALVEAGKKQLYYFSDMVTTGCQRGYGQPLSIWRRLLRQPAPIGEERRLSEDVKRLTFWTPQPLQIDLDFALEDVPQLHYEIDVLIRSGGFYLQESPD